MREQGTDQKFSAEQFFDKTRWTIESQMIRAGKLNGKAKSELGSSRSSFSNWHYLGVNGEVFMVTVIGSIISFALHMNRLWSC
jgi:hypothetical protein